MSITLASSLPVRLCLRTKPAPADERRALRATLSAAHLLGLAAGRHLRVMRASRDPLVELRARLEEAELRARLAWEAADILRSRFAKIPERRRPYFSPAERFRILEIKSLLGLSRDLAARLFLVCPNTLSNWETGADPVAETVGSTVKPVPPIRRFADCVRRLVQLMQRLGFGGEDLVAMTLARAGFRLAPRSVRRIVNERALATAPDVAPAKPTRPVVARFVKHVWMLDVTTVQTFLGGEIRVAGVFDAFSRAPLALQALERSPRAAEMARLLHRAAAAFGGPRYVITDLGGEFTGRVFRRAVCRLGAVQRFASRENLYATARLERFWRTLKDTASLRLRRPLTVRDLERRLEDTLAHYLVLRPHQGSAGRRPPRPSSGSRRHARQGLRRREAGRVRGRARRCWRSRSSIRPAARCRSWSRRRNASSSP